MKLMSSTRFGRVRRQLFLKTRARRWAFLCLAAGLFLLPFSGRAEEGVALAIVYDTSGSMKELVRGRGGRSESKDVIARRALDALVGQLRAFVTNAPASTPRRVETGVFVFSTDGAREFAPLSTFDAATAAGWSGKLPQPGGATPLGRTVEAASKAVLKSSLSRRHVLVITDGVNTAGPSPEAILQPLLQKADKAGTPVFTHFVAFDVAARHFEPVKKLGATVVGAADELQLNTQLSLILEEKILLEAEDPKPKK